MRINADHEPALPDSPFQLVSLVWRVDIRTPGIQAWLTAFANIVTIVALTTLPLWLAARKFRLWQFLCMGCTLGVGLGMLGERIAMPAALFIVGSLLISLLMDILAAVLRRQPKK